ncbi:MAG: hypothetical protein LBU20_02110 [Candidatus Nomurabacteria bacterium]|jgi:SAM-dependent methyltransferase|nr:hypothetical protein [Candidatus Nomurabacteria bacterium]
MIDWLGVLTVLVVCSFAAVCFFGAPFVPTRRKWAQQALELAKLGDRDLVVDLGSGSGTILRILAERRIRAVGFELNPILWLVSKLRFLKNNFIQVRLRNFWRQDLPAGTTAVYVFALTRDARKLEEYFLKQAQKSGFSVITFGFELPTKKAAKHTKGAFLYNF